MNITIVTLFPDLYAPFLNTSLVARSKERGIATFDVRSLLSVCAPKERADAPTFGHQAGMLLRPEVVERAVHAIEQDHGKAYKIFLSPHGKRLDQTVARSLAQTMRTQQHVAFFPARYEGMDARVEEAYADEVISIGDYVLMGGDLPVMVILEAALRLLPGVVGNDESVLCDSFSSALVDHPEYTAPVEWHGMKVPEVLRSGNHKAIADWQRQTALERTVQTHFDWARQHAYDAVDKKDIASYIPPHYVVLMHDEIKLPGDLIGTTSITSLDIHDIARSARTYGLQGYYLVTPLEDQARIAHKLLSFWNDDEGIAYNPHRHEALKSVSLKASFDEVVAAIKETHQCEPVIIGTTARAVQEKIVYYNEQSRVWADKRPVVFVLGTGRGLSEEFLARCTYIMAPLGGFSSFNHLSVRSAAAIMFDRWLGSNPVRHTSLKESFPA
jgi:tRNA (guanine37-N1)-methyltransferase